MSTEDSFRKIKANTSKYDEKHAKELAAVQTLVDKFPKQKANTIDILSGSNAKNIFDILNGLSQYANILSIVKSTPFQNAVNDFRTKYNEIHELIEHYRKFRHEILNQEDLITNKVQEFSNVMVKIFDDYRTQKKTSGVESPSDEVKVALARKIVKMFTTLQTKSANRNDFKKNLHLVNTQKI